MWEIIKDSFRKKSSFKIITGQSLSYIVTVTNEVKDQTMSIYRDPQGRDIVAARRASVA